MGSSAFLMVHAILGVRPPAEKEGRGSDSEVRKDHITTVADAGLRNHEDHGRSNKMTEKWAQD
jgi:hypothetical protein